MTAYQKQQLSWLEWRSQVTGKSVDEIRTEMRNRSKLADKSKSGFASLEPEVLKEISAKGGRKNGKKT